MTRENLYIPHSRRLVSMQLTTQPLQKFQAGMKVKCPFCEEWHSDGVYSKKWGDWQFKCPKPYFKKTGYVPRYHTFVLRDNSYYEIR
jgi:hypothetical protein